MFLYTAKQTSIFLKNILYGLWLTLIVLSAAAQPSSETPVRLNQVGFYPNAPKIAVVEGTSEGPFYLTTPDQQDTVFTGNLSAEKKSLFSQKTTRIADFSAWQTPGTYVVCVPGIAPSHPFDIRPQAFHEVAQASMKAFYFHRLSTPLPEKYAGPWARPAGHPDTEVLIHPSAATDHRPAGSKIRAPRGWYDAGDYNKYIVNSGITTGTLLSLYEDFPAYFDTLGLNIPESENEIPDLLDEVLWNLRWMLTMQDPEDGGVYHKLTNANFDGMVMPAAAKSPRYVVQKGTAATLNLAAVAAQASRIFQTYEQVLPGLADSCLQAASKAWEWAQAHPAMEYNQEQMNEQYDPDVSTGAYGDQHFEDEFIWAAAELYVTTQKDTYYQAVDMFPDDAMPLPSWSQVRLLGYYTLGRFSNTLTPAAQKDLPALKKRISSMADQWIRQVDDHAYQTVMGQSERDFIWGSSSVAANQGIALLQAYRLTSDKKYVRYALYNLDYLLGRNATGYSFVTGYGDKTPMHPHHRPSVADGIEAPVPGWVAGGPNANAPRQDGCTSYTSKAADEVYTDDDCSYASNEVAINWNAPFAYLAGALEALQFQVGYAEQ